MSVIVYTDKNCIKYKRHSPRITKTRYRVQITSGNKKTSKSKKKFKNQKNGHPKK
jgi:hypothetical protein